MDMLHLGVGVIVPAVGVATTLASIIPEEAAGQAKQKKTKKLPSPVSAHVKKERGEPAPEPAEKERAADTLCKFALHLGPVSVDRSKGFSLNQGIVLGTEGRGLGLGVEAVAKLTSGSCAFVAEATVRHQSNWYDLQPVLRPAVAFRNLLLQIQADYKQIVPTAMLLDTPGFYGGFLAEVVLPKLREMGWTDTDGVCHPCFIYGRFRVQAAIGAEFDVKYGETDDDGFRWYGMAGGVSFGKQLKLEAALGILAAEGQSLHHSDAIQIRITVTNLRLSFVLSKRALGLRQVHGYEFHG
jgi:hypothetical protein